ncbi:hypothetical protein [Nocardia farcinica]
MSEQTTQTRWAAARLRILLANHGQDYTRRRPRRLHQFTAPAVIGDHARSPTAPTGCR